jgi:competence protein ComEA
MRSRKSANDHVAEVARRRLELLSAELAATRSGAGEDPPSHPDPGGAGEPFTSEPAETPLAEDAGAAPVAGGQPLARRPAPGRHARRTPSSSRTARPAAWLEDRLPPSLQGRVRIGAGHLATVAVLVATAMALLAWSAVRAADPGDLVPARSALAAPASPAVGGSGSPPGPDPAPLPGASASGSSVGQGVPGPVGEVVVDVAGKVRRPGIVRLPAGSRVVDALEAAGGPRRGVRLTALNLARILVDGEQVLVGVPAAPGVAASAASDPGAPAPAALVNLNTADQTLLESLPGVGPVTAQAILEWRSEHGAFSAVDELMEVSGIGEATLAELAPLVTV